MSTFKDHPFMQLIASRLIPFIDAGLSEGHAREALFRNRDGDFLLYLSDSTGAPDAEERIIQLNCRDALIWINESAEMHGSFWE